MIPFQIALAAAFAGLVGLLAGVDASRRGQSRLVPAIAVGVVALAATVGVVAADGLLLSAYAALNGQAVTASTPRELLGLTVAATAVVAGTVLSGYGLFLRLRHPA